MTELWRSLEDVPADFGPTVVTLGNFDGVHRGHQAVLETLVADARAAGHRSVAVTFDPHPRAVHRPDSPPTLITGIEDRIERLAATGLDAVLVVHYTLDFARQSPEEFVRTWFVDGLRAATVVIGHDTTFGWGNAGHAETMRELGEQMGFRVEIVEWAGVANGSERRWSSTWVRELIGAGDVAGAARVLGRPHRLRGEIVHGDALGREIGFPTANLDVYAGMLPAHGVYAGTFTVVDPGPSADAATLVGEPHDGRHQRGGELHRRRDGRECRGAPDRRRGRRPVRRALCARLHRAASRHGDVRVGRGAVRGARRGRRVVPRGPRRPLAGSGPGAEPGRAVPRGARRPLGRLLVGRFPSLSGGFAAETSTSEL